jgi:hypothetical protein
MGKEFGRKRKAGRPRHDGYDLPLMLQVDVGAAITGKSVNAFIDALSPGNKLRSGPDKANIKRRYYKRRMLMTPIKWPDGRREEGPVAKAYAAFLAHVRITFGAT